MACCAFAVMILMQLLAPVAWLKRRLWPGKGPTPEPATAWRLQPALASGADSGPLRQINATRVPFRRWVGIAAGAELALLILLTTAAIPAQSEDPGARDDRGWTDEAIWYEAMHDSWCRALGIQPAAE